MKRTWIFLLLLISSRFLNAQITTLLDIPPRIQWPNNDGYCGENSIQMCGLYYGNYISEGICRTVAGGELLIYVNDTIALNAFSFTYVEWNPNLSTPQYTNYLDWVKQYLYKRQPVIIAVYVSGLTDPDYDHIIPAIGFHAMSVNSYTASDSLTYNSNFDTVPFSRVFSTLYATRSMAGNSATFPYYIPESVDYGVAVTGNKDPGKVTRPVHIALDSNDEPNVSLGAKACILKAKITADSLTPGVGYALLKYTNYLKVPSTGFSPSNANSAVYFTATSVTHTVLDSFLSDSAVFYRCIKYTPTGISTSGNVAEDKFHVFPNPSSGKFTLLIPDRTEQIVILNAMGQVLQKIKVSNLQHLEVNLPDEGVYFIRVSGMAAGVLSTSKLIVVH